jgi:hypothetical protein
MMTDLRKTPRQQISFEPYLRPAYAQCWSQTANSDTLIRAFSRVVKDPIHHRNTVPGDEGVIVRSRPSKLLSAVQKWAAPREISCFVGAIQYESDKEIQQRFVNLIDQYGPSAVGRGQLRAESLLFKRQEFSHEAEVRIICVDESNTSEQDVIRVEIDPSEVFEEIAFDPRLELFDGANVRQKYLI